MGIYGSNNINPISRKVSGVNQTPKVVEVRLEKPDVRASTNHDKQGTDFGPILNNEQNKYNKSEQPDENIHTYETIWKKDPKFPHTHVLRCCNNPKHIDYSNPDKPKPCSAKIQAPNNMSKEQHECKHEWQKIKATGLRIEDRRWETFHCSKCNLTEKRYDPDNQIQLLEEYLKELKEQKLDSSTMAHAMSSQIYFNIRQKLEEKRRNNPSTDEEPFVPK